MEEEFIEYSDEEIGGSTPNQDKRSASLGALKDRVINLSSSLSSNSINNSKKINTSNSNNRMSNDLNKHNTQLPITKNADNASKTTNNGPTTQSQNDLDKDKNKDKESNKKDDLKKKVAEEALSDALQAYGVPKGATKAILNSKLGQKALDKGLNKGLGKSMTNPLSSLTDKKKKGDDSDEPETIGIKFSKTAVKLALILGIPALAILIFLNLLVSGTQVYLTAKKLGHADSLSEASPDSIVNDEEMNEGVNDEEYNKVEEENEEASLLPIIDENYFAYVGGLTSFSNNKLFSSNYILTESLKKSKRPNNEADLSKLKDFYSGLTGYAEDYDMNMVYDFFFKLYYIYNHYEEKYSVSIDLPLLMATLNMQSTDMTLVFSSNIENYDKDSKENNPYFAYDYDWKNYETTTEKSEHDIEILVQHMVSRQVKEYCVNASMKETKSNTLRDSQIGTVVLTCSEGETYKTQSPKYVLDDKKYKEFLQEFVEKKYFEKGNTISTTGGTSDAIKSSLYSNSSSNGDSQATNIGSKKVYEASNKLAEELANVAQREFVSFYQTRDNTKYNLAYGTDLSTPWCTTFVWYNLANTNVDGISLYPNIITIKTSYVGELMDYFHSNPSSNIKFHYNDNCSKFSGRNGSTEPYNPKIGDIVFLDFDEKWSDFPNTQGYQDHSGILVNNSNGILELIEGNVNLDYNRVVYKRQLSINSCEIIGYGSWY